MKIKLSHQTKLSVMYSSWEVISFEGFVRYMLSSSYADAKVATYLWREQALVGKDDDGSAGSPALTVICLVLSCLVLS